MDTRTGEIVPGDELERRLAQMSAEERAKEERYWERLKEFEAEMLQNPSMTPAERIAFKVRSKLAAQR